MSIVSSIVRILRGNTQAQPLQFRCQACEHAFESTVKTMGPISCPVCGEGNVRRIE